MSGGLRAAVTSVTSANAIFSEALARYPATSMALSFNGGKDCTVVLHLLRAYLAASDLPPTTDGTLHGIRLVFFAAPHPFPEVTAFVDGLLAEYGLSLVTYDGFKSGLVELAASGVSAIMLGTRNTDPDGVGLGTFAPTSAGWPDMMRVNPVLEWTYGQVWDYLRGNGLPYCQLYDHGYTSLGSTVDTRPNPELESADGTRRPAWDLEDASQERLGRGRQEAKPTPPPAAVDVEALADMLLEADTGGDKKKKKKKKKKGKKGGGGAGGDPVAGGGGGVEPAAPQLPPEEALRRELSWCIAQLLRGLSRPDCDADQAKETRGVLKTLQSPKTALVKRRATMKRVFGDYRALMKTMPIPEEELAAVELPPGPLVPT